MNFKPKLIYIVFPILFTCFTINPAIGHERSELSDEAIALWVADRIGMSEPFDMPSRHYVDKATLGSVFREGNQKSFSRWQEDYGEDEADRILKGYLENVLGLFNENTLNIYVADFIDSCSRQAIFAHEMVHYFQFLLEGVIPEGSFNEGDERLMREMQAYHIQDEYLSAFCQKDNGAAPKSDDNAFGS